ncbi:MAG: protease modulator HflC [Gemmataceae bacterium]
MSWRWLVLLPVAGWLVYASLYAVDATEFAYVTQFGRKVAVHDGGKPDEAGLWVKLPWPIQAVQRIDRRLQTFDIPGAELLTRDAAGDTIDKTLTLDAYVSWRIAGSDGADRFVRTLGTVEAAQRLLGQRVASELGAAVPELELEDLVSVQPGRVERQREALRTRLLEGGTPPLRKAMLEENGVEVVDIRLRRAGYPTGVREAIFDRIRSERGRKASEYTSEGERLASDIRSEAERDVAKMKADAEAEAKRLVAQAEAEADRIRNEVQRADPKFYDLLRKMEDYQRILGDGKSTLLLSTHRELFDLLYNPPTVQGGKK